MEFSHNGKFLASASKDHTVIIWSVEVGTLAHLSTRPLLSLEPFFFFFFDNLFQQRALIFRLTDHEESVSFLAWSPDDSMLLSCGRDKKTKLWDTKSGALLKSVSRHLEEVTSCAWLPSGNKFLTSSPDKNLFLWDIDGNCLQTWATLRVFNMTVDSTGTKAYLVCNEAICVYPIAGGKEDV